MKAVIISPDELRRVAVHESGHAVIAVVKNMPCYGFFFSYDPKDTPPAGELKGKFCVVVMNSNPWKIDDYLQAAAGASAEQLFFGKYETIAGRADRAPFDDPDAPSWETAVYEAQALLEGMKEKVATMAKLFQTIHRNIPIENWPDRGMDGSTMRFREMIGEQTVQQIVKSEGVPENVTRFFASVEK